MTSPPTRGEGPSALSGRAAARLVARPGISIAAGTPIALVVVAFLPVERPVDLIPCLLALVAVAVLVLTAEMASFDARDARPQVAAPQARHTSWRDPAMVSVERWMTNWPGIAGVSAVSWWAARAGAGGLLADTAFRAIGIHHPVYYACASMVMVAVATCLSAGRHLVHLALGAVALSGFVATASGALAALHGSLTTHLVPGGPLWPSTTSANPIIVEATTTVAVLCLGGACLLAVIPATSVGAGNKSKWAIWATVGTAIATWGFVLPILLRGAGLDLHGAVHGGPGSLRSCLAVLLGPLAGGEAGNAAKLVVFVGGLAGAIGALSGASGLAESAVHAARVARRRSFRAAVNAEMPWTVAVTSAGASALAAGAVASEGVRTWLMVALGAMACGALALTTLAPPVIKQCQRVPAAVRAAVASIWVLVIIIGIGAAGPMALAVVGVGTLGGAFVIGWRGSLPGGQRHAWRSVPWSTISAALVTTSAVTAMEMMPSTSGAKATGMWQGLAVVVMAAGILVLAIYPATSRQRLEHLASSAQLLAGRALPALSSTLEAVANGEPAIVPVAELSDLKAAARLLEAELGPHGGGSDDLAALTAALVDASQQALRLAVAVEAVGHLNSQRLEELVEERVTTLSKANRTLVDSQWRRRQLLDRTVRVAEGERARIAANIHDGPIQRLAAIGLVLDRCRLRLDRDDKTGTRDLVKRARSELSDEISSLRRMMSELRPPILDEGGLDAALRDHLANWSADTGIEARLESSPYGQLSANKEMVVYRVVQEALANVAKHARAQLTTVTLSAASSGVQVVIRDDGRGFSAQSQPDLLRGGHFGLVVMRERVELAAGRFEVRSAPRTGTEIALWLPATQTEPMEAA